MSSHQIDSSLLPAYSAESAAHSFGLDGPNSFELVESLDDDYDMNHLMQTIGEMGGCTTAANNADDSDTTTITTSTSTSSPLPNYDGRPYPEQQSSTSSSSPSPFPPAPATINRELIAHFNDEIARKCLRIEELLNDERRMDRQTAMELKALLGMCLPIPPSLPSMTYDYSNTHQAIVQAAPVKQKMDNAPSSSFSSHPSKAATASSAATVSAEELTTSSLKCIEMEIERLMWGHL